MAAQAIEMASAENPAMTAEEAYGELGLEVRKVEIGLISLSGLTALPRARSRRAHTHTHTHRIEWQAGASIEQVRAAYRALALRW